MKSSLFWSIEVSFMYSFWDIAISASESLRTIILMQLLHK